MPLLGNHVTLVTLTEYFRNRRSRSILQKYMVAKVSQFPCEFHWHSQWLHLNNLFYKTSMLTPFVEPRQVLSYLDVAIAKKSQNLNKIACEFRDIFQWNSRKLVARIFGSVSRGAPSQTCMEYCHACAAYFFRLVNNTTTHLILLKSSIGEVDKRIGY